MFSNFEVNVAIMNPLLFHFTGVACRSSVVSPVTRRSVVVRAAAAPTKKPDQADKRARQNEKRRVYHKAKKSEVSTRMKKVDNVSAFI